ncbi:MAG: hypothetical protein C0412_11685 [Flavobacterium sp.]|nr:hypothetical protein [Flavobacterium sp.]
MGYFISFMSNNIKYFYVLIIALCCIGMQSQEIRNLGVKDGINGRQTFNVKQDKKGFIWISTRFGVDKFDGKNITNYNMDVLYKGSNPVRTIQLVLDKDSTVWAYTSQGTIYKYQNQQDKFTVFKHLGFYLSTLHIDRNNAIWIGTKSYFALLKDNTVKIIKNEALKNHGIKLIQDYDSANLLVVTNKNIFKFHIKNKTLTPLIDKNSFKATDFRIETAYYDEASKKLWIGSLDKGMFVYDMVSHSMLPIADSRLIYHPILKIYPLDESFLMIGTEGVGLCLLNKKTRKIERIYNQWEQMKSRISGDVIYDIYKDKEGKVWLSTFSNGINILDYKKRNFNIIKHEENNPNSLSRNIVSDIVEDADKNLWFATNDGISFWNKKTNIWQRFLDLKNILTLYEDKSGNIWVGTFSSGAYVLDKKGNILKHYLQERNSPQGIGTNFVYTITGDSEGNMWFGGIKGNLSKLDVRANKFVQTPLLQANHIVQFSKNKMLVASESGVQMLSIDGKQATPCVFNKNLKSFFISDMYVQSDSIIWLATYGDGINKCNLKTGKIERFTSKSGLPSNFIHAFIFDNGNLWISSENGLSKLDIKTKSITNFSVADGLSDNRFRQLSRTKGADGILYFGSYDGVTYFDPKKIKTLDSYTRITFQNFYLFNQIVKPGIENSPLETAIDESGEIKLEHDQNSFSIDFTTIDFLNSDNRKYKWKLEGLDREWIGPAKEHIANYTNLSPGDYTFRVKYVNDSNKVLDERAIKITVSPPFWNTIWARILELLLVIAILYSVNRYMIQMFKKKQSEEMINFFIGIVHDIRTPLTLISGPINDLKQELEPSKKTDYLLDLIGSNLDKLNKMASRLLDFQKVFESKDQLFIEQQNVNEYLKEKSEYWKPVAYKKGLNLNLFLPKETLVEFFDTDKMDKIIDNLVSNAIKYTPEGGTVSISLINDANFWQIELVDNGIGIPKSESKNLFNRFFRSVNAIHSKEAGSGLGLLLIKQYVTLHKGEVWVDSAEGQGSKFYIRFKHGSKHYQDHLILDNVMLPVAPENDLPGNKKDTDKLKIKLLVVEDNADLRMYMKQALSKFYKVEVASNGLEAWENIAKINPDLVVSDLQMPEMDGFELCEKIKNTFETSHIPIILLTVVDDKLYVEKGFNLGADDYIGKPFEIKYLRTKIDNLILNRNKMKFKFLDINKYLPADEPVEKDFNLDFIKRATQIIERNITNTDFSIADLSKEIGLSRSLLYMKFSITGYSPNNFIKIVKMNKAIQLFKENKYSINEVAFMVGFDEPAYFSTCFKKIYGKTPKQFIEEGNL